MAIQQLAGRYSVLHELGRGGMGVVYRVRDEQEGRDLALKLLMERRFSDSALRHFEREFRTLTDLSHPHLTEVFDFGRATPDASRGPVPFFTMEFVDGEPLDRYLTPGRPDLDRLYACLAQVGLALAYLHDRGIVHQDVKPSNILVTTVEGRPHVKLMDLGLAGAPRRAGEPGRIRGTVAYLSPEAAAGGRLDPRADLYNLGCVTYELVTGRPPFGGASALSILRGHMEEEPIPPRTLNSSIPEALDALIVDLLAKDPGLRPASARRLLERLEQVSGQDLRIETPEVRRQGVLGSGFVGRGPTLEQLAQALDRARQGAGRLTMLAGDAGIGKTRLLREFRVRCQLDGTDVFLGRGGDERSAGALAEALGAALRARGPLSAETRERFGELIDRWLGESDEGAAPPREATPPPRTSRPFSFAAAVAALLRDLTREGPLVLALDDLHRADETTCTLLGHVAGALAPDLAGEAGLPVLIVATYRADEVSRQSPLFDLLAEGRDREVVAESFLEPLAPGEIGTMLRAMLGAPQIPAEFVERVAEQTRGNPLYLEELVALLAEEGLVVPGEETSLDPDALDRVELPERVRDLLDRRVRRLAPAARELLHAGAVLGGDTLEPDALTGVTGLRYERVVDELRDLEAAALVDREEDDNGAPVYRLAHPALASIAADRADETSVDDLRQRAIAYLDRRGIPRRHAAWDAFARLCEAANMPGRAIEAYGRAGELAALLNGHRDAIDFFGRAIELVLKQSAGAPTLLCGLYEKRGRAHALAGDLQRAEEDFRWMLARADKAGDDGLRARAHLLLADALALGSRYGEAQDNLELAVEITGRLDDPAWAVRAQIGLGRVLGQLGLYDEGQARLDEALTMACRAGLDQPALEARLAKGSLFREQGNFRSSLECFREAAEGSEGGASPELEEIIQEGSALALEVQGQHREALAAYEAARESARDRSDFAALARLTSAIGNVLMKGGDYERARHELETALDRYRRLGAREGVVVNLQQIAQLQSYVGRLEPALETAHEALREAIKLGKQEQVAACLNAIGGLHLKMGDAEGASRHLEEAQQIMREIRSSRGLAVFLCDLGELRLHQQRIDEARRHFQESAFLARKVADRRLESIAMNRLGESHLAEHNYDRALVAGRKALKLVEGSGLLREEADGRRLRARIELARPGGDVVRAELDALEALKRYRELSEPEQVWQAEHLVARAAWRLGRREEAVERLRRAHRYLERVRDRLGERWRKTFLDDPRRRELYDDWQRMGASAGEVAPVDEGDAGAVGGDYARLQAEVASLKRLLEINHAFNQAGDEAGVVAAILDAGLELTGAERSFLLLRDGEEIATHEARGPGGRELEAAERELSRSVARQTMESGESLLATDAESDEKIGAFESIHELSIRSVICVPLRIGGEVQGALYLDHRLDRGLFQPAHLELAHRLADQAGIAVHRSRLTASLERERERAERLNRELERTVRSQQDELASAREELSFTRSSFELRYRFEELVGGSDAMQRVYHLIERLAPKKLPILITGESGTGKELIARAVHAKSDRTGGPFFSVNCAALTDTLLESELFGYRKGAFTGAHRDKPGYFELAHEGTLFLDEIGELSLATQAKLLRAIERGEVFPVGGKSATRVDVRIVSATNRDLESMIGEGGFREDLFYRINVGRIHVPPLRDRREDIPLLVDHFLGLVAEEEGQERKEIEAPALKRLAAYNWPGNVRELQHQILRIATFSKGPTLTAKELARYGEFQAQTARPTAAGPGAVESLEETERRQIVRALESAGGNKTRAAEILGINRATLFRKLKRLGMQ